MNIVKPVYKDHSTSKCSINEQFPYKYRLKLNLEHQITTGIRINISLTTCFRILLFNLNVYIMYMCIIIMCNIELINKICLYKQKKNKQKKQKQNYMHYSL